MKLEDANKKAKEIITKLVKEKIKEQCDKDVKERTMSEDDINILFIIRDGLKSNPLDEWELENYDNCYGIEDI